MGQRLNIEIVDSINNKNVLANAYYHWSGYTSSALQLSDNVFEVASLVKKTSGTTKAAAIEILEATGASLTPDELLEADKLYPGLFSVSDLANRSSGLISISEEGISETRRWEEARVTFFLEDDKISFNVMYKCDEDEIENIDEIPVMDLDINNMTYLEFKDFECIIVNAIGDQIYSCKSNNIYYSFIE